MGTRSIKVARRRNALLETQGIVNASCFVELKIHNTPLLAREQYRSDCWRISDELAGSIAQVQKTVKRFEQELRSKIEIMSDEGDPTGDLVFAYAPKSYVVIGSLQQFKTAAGINESKYSSFELFRRNVVSPEIITYDELYEHAKYIVAQSVEASGATNVGADNPAPAYDEDIPF